MQTFVPYDSYIRIAASLDNKRLGKQRVEAMQILNCLRKPNRWKNHPAVRMWQGYEQALAVYMDMTIMEWTARGFKNTMPFNYKMEEWFDLDGSFPWWFGDEAVHKSHRQMLVWKSIDEYLRTGKPDTFNWYAKQGWHEEYTASLDTFGGYVWPVELKSVIKPKDKLVIPKELL